MRNPNAASGRPFCGAGLVTLLGACLLALQACGDDGQASAGGDAAVFDPFEVDCGAFEEPADPGELPGDVKVVLTEYCYKCHGGPDADFPTMPLVTWADFQRCNPNYDDNQAWFQRAIRRVNNDATPMPPILEPQLPDAEKALLNQWLASGAPAAENWP